MNTKVGITMEIKTAQLEENKKNSMMLYNAAKITFYEVTNRI